jgi:hypothetical protein
MKTTIKVARTSPTSEEIKASSSRNDLLFDIIEYAAKIIAKIIGSTTWVRYIAKIKMEYNTMNLDLGIVQTFSRTNAKINKIKATVEGANQRKGCRKYIEPLNAF